MRTCDATGRSKRLRDLIAQHRDEVDGLLADCGVSNPRLFGSVARGDAGEDSDVDIMVDTERADPDLLFNLGGLSVRLERVLGVKVDVVCEKLMRRDVSFSAVQDLVPL